MMRRILAWVLLFLAAILVLSGIIDLAIGPDLAEQELASRRAEGGSRWYGIIYVVIGLALGALGHRLGRNRPPRSGASECCAKRYVSSCASVMPLVRRCAGTRSGVIPV